MSRLDDAYEELGRLYEALDGLSDDDLLTFHREVCRRAALIYGPRYRTVRDANFRTAMTIRDTRFRAGLSPLENMRRSHDLGRA